MAPTASGSAPTCTCRPALGAVPAIMLPRVPRTARRTADMAFDVQAEFFARKGYACVIQDVRGKFSVRGGVRPRRRCPGRRRLRLGRLGGRAAVVQRPRRPVGRVVLRLHVVGGGDQRPRGDPLPSHPATSASTARGSWFRQGALLLQNTTGYWAMAMDAREYADLTAIDAWHLPLAGNWRVRPGSRPRCLDGQIPGARRRRRVVAASASSAYRLPEVRCLGAELGRPVRHVPRPAADRSRVIVLPRSPPGAGDGASSGRPVGSRGLGRAHRPRGLRAAAAHRAASLGCLPGVLRPLPARRGQRLRPRRAGRRVHDRPPAAGATSPFLRRRGWPRRRSTSAPAAR